MLTQDTTFIIGAGASYDLGFPLGNNLRDEIIQFLALENPNDSLNFKDQTLNRVLQAHSQTMSNSSSSNAWLDGFNSFRQAAKTISQGLPFARSIDSFLDSLKEKEEVVFLGKLAIATVILRAEASSPLSFKPPMPSVSNRGLRSVDLDGTSLRKEQLAKVLSSWHSELGQILFEGHSPATLDHIFDHATFIVFNYDRCVEEFLTIALTRRFAVERGVAEKILSRARIIHPYGQVGGTEPGSDGYVPFGHFEDHQLVSVASRIRTYTEAAEEEVSDLIKSSVAQASRLVFLGFGWLPQNMDLLHVGLRVTDTNQVFATTMQMPKGEIAIVSDQINQILRRGAYTPDYHSNSVQPPELTTELGNCKALMTNCWMRLTRTSS